MIEHNRKDNCIKFLPICADDCVLVVDDAKMDASVKNEEVQKDVSRKDEAGVKNVACRLEFCENGKAFEKADKVYDYCIYSISNTIEGGKDALIKKIQRAFRVVKEDGSLVLLMDNPYSLHMFAGEAGRDGKLFEAFEKKEKEVANVGYFMLKEALESVCGKSEVKWYYPYPTLEFPVAIYSDLYLPKCGECVESYYNFDYARLELFKEEEAFDEVIKSGMFSHFANCYMVVIGEAAKAKIKYTRFSNERAQGLRIRTDIYEDEVRKVAYDKASITHIQKFSMWEGKLNQQLINSRFNGKECEANHIKKTENGSASFEFVQGVSLEQMLDELLFSGETQKVQELLKELTELLYNQPDLKEFEVTKEFKEVFGEVSEDAFDKITDGKTPLLSAAVTDIDMICQNILIGDKVTVIDYEWSFDFPIPIPYLIYRILFFFLEFKDRKRYFEDIDLYEEFGITKERKEVFVTMEANFQRYVQGDVKLLSDSFFEKGKPILKREILQKELERLLESTICIQLKAESGTKEIYRECRKDADGIVSFTIDFKPGEVKEVVILPKTENGLMRICLLQEDEEGSKELKFYANGIGLNPILYLFDKQAEITTEKLLERTHRIYVSLEVVALPDTFVVESKRGIHDLQENLANRELQLKNMKNSTSWRITKPLRRLKGNKDDE